MSADRILLDTAYVQALLSDKSWDLTDCISFVMMGDHDLAAAVTSDIHFQQAGYRTLLAETE